MVLRLDRLTTLYVVDPWRRHRVESKASIPVLMYHSIAQENESGAHPYYRTATAPSVFAAQMEALHNAGFSVIGIEEALQRVSTAQKVENSVVITFDDGYRNFYTNAFPVLARHGFTATMFLPTAHIGHKTLSFKGKACLTWPEVRELRQHGMCFGSHTVTHPQLRDLDARSIREELGVSKQIIEQELDCAVLSFSYPYAFPEADNAFKAKLKNELKQAGYQNGVCTSVGRLSSISDPLFLNRLPVNSEDDPRLFQAKLAGSYDWIARPQYIAKMAKMWVHAESHRQGESASIA
jgi:peptidoglycan/xylan/chitin deacetylase (PgdA/CDA1 family)